MSVPVKLTTVLSITLLPTLARSSPASKPVNSVTCTAKNALHLLTPHSRLISCSSKKSTCRCGNRLSWHVIWQQSHTANSNARLWFVLSASTRCCQGFCNKNCRAAHAVQCALVLNGRSCMYICQLDTQ